MEIHSIFPPCYLYLNGSPQAPLKIEQPTTLGSIHPWLNQSRCRQLAARHCRIDFQESSHRIVEGPGNPGLILNRTRVREAFLSDGDEVQLGEILLTYRTQTERQTHPNGQQQPERGSSCPQLSSKNALWAQQLARVPRIANSSLSVLITGPSGSGKELLARQVHDLSTKKRGPYVALNCSALSESLVESELFGHLKGSFTGASDSRSGAFLQAEGGTLFLDEIGDLPPSLQPKLLRAIDNQEIRPVGSDKTLRTNVRIVAATQVKLIDRIHKNLFREDLYFRLCGFHIQAPPLCERMEDFQDLLFLFAKRFGIGFGFQAIAQLQKHSWPGNIRELKHTVERASVLFKGQTVQPEDLKHIVESNLLEQPTATESAFSGPVLAEIEREMILRRLKANRGNQRKTAIDLNLAKSTLHDRIRSYGFDPREFKSKGT